jgi:hypothetical protein
VHLLLLLRLHLHLRTCACACACSGLCLRQTTGMSLAEGCLIRAFLQPSDAVQERLTPVLAQLQGHLVIGMAIRTTVLEPGYSPHLAPGDELLFAACAAEALDRLRHSAVAKQVLGLCQLSGPRDR